MLLKDVDSHIWEQEFQKKFNNFAKHSPILLSIYTKTQDDELGALITHSNSGMKYFFPFDYSLDVKDFIANIKQVLVDDHYPRLVQEIMEKHEFTNDDIALELEKGKTINNIPKYKMQTIGTRIFIIDKIFLWKNIFLLKIIESTFKDDVIGTVFKYQYNGSGVIYLKKYRTNEFGTIENASEHFFSNSLLVSTIDTKKRNDIHFNPIYKERPL